MTNAAQVIALVGGEKTIGRGLASELDIARLIRGGLPVDVVDHLLALGVISQTEVDRIIASPRQLTERRRKGCLTPDQSGRVIRVARVIADAVETFRSQQKALTWLHRPSAALEGEVPLDLLDTEEGARVVEHLLCRIAHGMAA
jgi:putative toxin-antitoxin system antitoxin component (TIGR02293 family)